MTIKELQPRVAKALSSVVGHLADINGCTSTQSLQCKHKLEGQLLVLEAIHQAIKNDNRVFLDIIGG